VPTSSEILASLAGAASGAMIVAIAWHVVVGGIAIALLFGFDPSRRSAALALSLPLGSVSAVAWYFGNPFNGAVLAVAAVTLAALAVARPPAPKAPAEMWAELLGAFLVVLGWVYPHFLGPGAAWIYLYAAPLGVLPCPTLALVSGAALWRGGLVGGAWRIALATVSAFYALVGVLRLGVALDAFLLLGSIGLLAQHVRAHGRPAVPSPGV